MVSEGRTMRETQTPQRTLEKLSIKEAEGAGRYG